MADIHSNEVRTYNMSRIRSKNTKPEIIVRKYLFANGYRFWLHSKLLPGKPDIVLPKYNTVILINGCFWHGHNNCRYFVVLKTRTDWWLHKINSNRANDEKKQKELEALGWKVLFVWECELKPNKYHDTLQKVMENIMSGD